MSEDRRTVTKGALFAAAADEPSERRVLVTVHFPIEMQCYTAILRAVSRSYPDAVVGENGTVWNRRADEEGQ